MLISPPTSGLSAENNRKQNHPMEASIVKPRRKEGRQKVVCTFRVPVALMLILVAMQNHEKKHGLETYTSAALSSFSRVILHSGGRQSIPTCGDCTGNELLAEQELVHVNFGESLLEDLTRSQCGGCIG
jgi:hypothetical protein